MNYVCIANTCFMRDWQVKLNKFVSNVNTPLIHVSRVGH